MAAKLSSRGVRFFAHIRRPESCSVGHETAAHLELKAITAATAREHGWEAQIEATGSGWRADVLTTDPRSGKRIAWEIQRSPIPESEVESRTARHRTDNISTVWVAKKPWPWCEQFAALILPDKDGLAATWTVTDRVCTWQAVLDLAGHTVRWVPTSMQYPSVVGSILDGLLTCEEVSVPNRWGWHEQSRQWIPRHEADTWIAEQPPIPDALPARLILKWMSCYRCERETVAVVGIRPFDPAIGTEYRTIDAEHEGVLARIQAAMAGKVTPSTRLPIGAIKRRFSKRAGGQYLSNGCFWCDAILGNWYLYGPGATVDGVNMEEDSDESPDDESGELDSEHVIGPISINRLRKMRRQSQSL